MTEEIKQGDFVWFTPPKYLKIGHKKQYGQIKTLHNPDQNNTIWTTIVFDHKKRQMLVNIPLTDCSKTLDSPNN